MKPGTRLELAVFQLTPTRTRCDLVIVANGKTEKIASGLIKPFLSHLKSAREQFAKGGYSIELKPEFSTDAGSWFTKYTVERFVRFVSTPVVLERVYILESEIIQLEKNITIQKENDAGLSTVGDVYSKNIENTYCSVEKDEGTKLTPDVNEEKAIVLYEPSTLASEETSPSLHGQNSKVQLLKVLEARKSLLQNEQRMAFARALAAGFDINHIAPLVSFAECFGASRLMDACTRFVDIWKAKHGLSQWLETEGADAASTQLDYAAMMASGIMLSSVAESTNGSGENNNSCHQAPAGPPNHAAGQFPYPVYAPWGVHSPPGTLPVFQAYPVQGMPYYQNHPGHGPYVYPPYQSAEDVVSSKKTQRRNSMETNGVRNESENLEMEAAETSAQYDSDLDKKGSHSNGLHPNTRSSKRKSGTVVIRNINYITPKKHNTTTDDDTDEEAGNTSGTRSIPSQRRTKDTMDLLSSANAQCDEKVPSSGHWQAFQNCLLRNSGESTGADQDMYSMEKEAKTKRRQTAMVKDPLADGGQCQSVDGGMRGALNIGGGMSCLLKGPNDELLTTGRGNFSNEIGCRDGSINMQVAERNGTGVRYRVAGDDFTTRRHEMQSSYAMSSSEISSANISASATQNVSDESFILPSRLAVPHEGGTAEAGAVDMNSEMNIHRIRSQDLYEPEDLGWIPERRTEQGPTGYDPALDYEMQVSVNKAAFSKSLNKDKLPIASQAANKSEGTRKTKAGSGMLDNKKNLGLMKRGKPSKLTPLDEARARADNLRLYKADLQKLKKEKEEEQKKRIEILKLERQKRIAAKTNAGLTQSVLSSQQPRKQLPTKVSPGSHKGSKFSDTEPGFSSPLQGISRRTLSLGAAEIRKTLKPKSIDLSISSGNKVSRSVSSLGDLKPGKNVATPESKPLTTKIRSSEPKKGIHQVSSVRRRNSAPLEKTNASAGPEIKKVSAIISLDKTKAATLPELKIRAPEAHGDISIEKSVVEHKMGNADRKLIPSTLAVADSNIHITAAVQENDVDDSSVVEKNVVVLECEKPSVTSIYAAKEIMRSQYDDHHSRKSTIEITREPSAAQLKIQCDSPEVMESRNEGDLSKEPPLISEPAKAYQAPHARVSSLEDICTSNSEYGRAPPTSLDVVTMSGTDTLEAPAIKLSQLNLESLPEELERPRVKESSKGGFKRLLKFGKKSMSTSGDHLADSDSQSPTSSAANHFTANKASVSHGTAPTLKNLISRDEIPTASTPPPKFSRHFSLLSPFRKSADKKIVIL